MPSMVPRRGTTRVSPINNLSSPTLAKRPIEFQCLFSRLSHRIFRHSVASHRYGCRPGASEQRPSGHFCVTICQVMHAGAASAESSAIDPLRHFVRSRSQTLKMSQCRYGLETNTLSAQQRFGSTPLADV
jgi:hypothetical protein